MHKTYISLLVLAAFVAASTFASPGRLCGPPEVPAHGSVQGGARSSYDLGEYVQYSCDEGYSIQGRNVAVCIYGEGSPSWNNPPPDCRPIDCGAPESPAKGRVTVPSGTTFGSRALYSCNKGFIIVGAEFRTCREDGQWYPTTPTCKYKFCIHLGSPDNGHVSLSGNGPGSTATYGCNLGYMLVGMTTRICQDDGEWPGSEPSCRLVECGPPELPENGEVATPDGTSYGAKARYSCKMRFELQGSEFRTCQRNGEWSPKAPFCKPEPAECDVLRAPDKGQVVLTGRSPGSVATYSCRPGYKLVGNPTRICQDDEQWSGSPPLCRPIDCGFLNDPLYGIVGLSRTTVGSTAKYSCSVGFVLVGEVSRTCQLDGRWSGEAPTCHSVDCGPLDYPPKGRVSLSGTAVGSTATYSCEGGYVLVGKRKRECLVTGEWSGKEPVCTVIDCGILYAPANGAVELTGTFLGDKAIYNCNPGYVLKGQAITECQVDGEWSGEEPVCKPIFCPELHNPLNGLVRATKKTVGSQAMYECFGGHVLIGDIYRTCLPNGEWSGDEPACRFVVCARLRDPANGMVSVSGNDFESKARYRCNPGYLLVGDETRACEANGYWSGQEPVCRSIGCAYLDNPRNGKVILTGTSIGSTATYSCNSGFTVVGKFSRRTCLRSGEWSGQAPTCRRKAVECDNLEDPENGETFLSSKLFGSTATYQCNPVFTLVGKETRMVVDCGSLQDPQDGQVVLSGTIFGSTANYTCNTGFVLLGDETRRCQANDEWSGLIPLCIPEDCGSLQDPENGRVDLTGTNFGSTATYSCNTGFILVGEQTRTCQASGEWSGRAATCQRKTLDCGRLQDPQDGQVILSGTIIGSTATYSCNTGFILVGEQTRTCQASGEWSGKSPFCRPVKCGNLDDPENGEVFLSSTLFGSTATYQCNPGFILVGKETRTCQANGKWSGRAPVCEPVDCGSLQDPQDGQVVLSGTIFGSNATYTCNTGFVLLGDETRRCQANGEWSGLIPLCIPEDCGSLQDPENGRVDLTGTNFGSTATYSCNTGFILVGEQMRTCQASGEWSGRAATCQPVDCGRLQDPRDGRVVLSGTIFGSTATYSCNTGFILVGEQTRTCQVSGEWSGKSPFCQPVKCGNLDDPENGEVFLSSTLFGSTATYQCNPGFILVGKETRTCQANGEWSGRAPVCKPVDCGSLQDPQNGQVVLSDTVFGSNATYTCNTGFVLLGDETRRCQANGEWSGLIPLCIPEDCGSLQDPENGRVDLTGTNFGSTATYSCNTGFILVGEQTRTCQASGEWSGRAATCQSVDCGSLQDPQDGQVVLSGTIFGSTATYSCNTGFILVGEQTRTCQASGEWSGKSPFCQPVDCGDLDDPDNGEVTLTGTTLGSMAIYSCNNGYFLEGKERRVCQSNREWSGKAPVCRLVKCGNLPNPKNGQVSLTGTTFGSRATYTCNKGFSLVGRKMRMCLANGQWMGEASTCKRISVNCDRLDAPDNGQIRLTGTTLGSRAMYICNKGFMLEGDALRTCQENGEWSGEDPICMRINCGVLRPQRNGLLRLTGTRVGDRASYSCLRGYILLGGSIRECLPSGTWSGEAPQCIQSKKPVSCGIPPVPSNGFAHVQCVTYGCRTTYWCRSGLTLSRSRKRVCQRSGHWSGDTPTCIIKYYHHYN